jgi:rhodanese-related sulfurtransferase
MFNSNAHEAREFFARRLNFITGPFELDGRIKRNEPMTVVDVRLPPDYRAGHIPGAINLPNGKWHTLAGVAKDRPAVIYCYNQTCKLATAAAIEFASQGVSVVEMEGGFDTWQKYGLPVAIEQ